MLAVIVLGLLAYKFAYLNNPSVIYSQALANTGKGYNKLIDYTDAQAKADYKGFKGDGSYSFKTSGFSSDGSISYKGDTDNSELTFDIGLAATRVKADILALKSTGNSPDVYIKASGVKGLGTFAGAPQLDAALAKEDNTWVVIDHTLFDNIGSSLGATPAGSKPPTRDQILDEARAFGKVNQQYLFSTKKDKALFQVVDKVGKEKVDGHNTYHYTVAWQKDNIKAYVQAQEDALKASKLEDWIKANHSEDSVKSFFDDLKKSAGDIKSSQAFDLWADSDHRIIYKIRNSDSKNKAQNYTDVGLDYRGGSSFPFFVAGQSKTGDSTSTYNLTAAINTDTNSVDFKLTGNDKGSSDTSTFSAKFHLEPTNEKVKLVKPASPKTLAQVLSDLGLGDFYSEFLNSSSGTQITAKDSKRRADIASIQTQLEASFTFNGYYPSLKDMNSASWLSANMKSLDVTALTDPSNANQTAHQLASQPGAGVYAYQPTNSSGGSCENDDKTCTKYTLTATLEQPVNGANTVTKTNLD